MKEKGLLIIEECLRLKDSVNPLEIFRQVAAKDFVRIHGPEHHVLDGACLLTAIYNAGGRASGELSLEAALERVLEEGIRMPGAMCGLWGACGAVTSIGAALSVMDGTGPLSVDGSWGEHMKYTSKALERLGAVNGPRCCKRDGFLALQVAVEYANEHYGVQLEMDTATCTFFARNQQCIGVRCPFYSKGVE